MTTQLARTVLVTGSSRGLGLEIVRQLATSENPPKVIIATCRNPDKATELQALAQNYQQIKVLKFDVVDYESLPRVVDEVKAAVEDAGLSLLVNNAGIKEQTPDETVVTLLQELKPHMFSSVLETNTTAPLMLTKALLPQLKMAAAASHAKVVNISSILGSMGAFTNKPGLYAYRASKAALNMVTKTLAENEKTKRLLFVAIHPGWVRTDMGTDAAPLGVEDSVSQVLWVVRNLKEEHNGHLLSFDGSVMPW